MKFWRIGHSGCLLDFLNRSTNNYLMNKTTPVYVAGGRANEYSCLIKMVALSRANSMATL